MRSDPYLSHTSIERFYTQDYQTLYIGEADVAPWFDEQYERGLDIVTWLSSHGICDYDTVFEIGCGAGGIVAALADTGRAAVGCDYGALSLNFGLQRGLDLLQGPPSVLASRGKADLIVASHVIEHWRDPVSQIRALTPFLNKGGLLFIEVPGIMRLDDVYGDLLLYLQNAHVSHFCLRSLDFVMALAGFTRHCGDEGVRAVYEASGRVDVKPDPCLHMDVRRYLELSEHNRQSRLSRQLTFQGKRVVRRIVGESAYAAAKGLWRILR